MVGALDELAGVDRHTRGDIISRIRELNSVVKRPPIDPNQPMLDLEVIERIPTGNQAFSAEEKVQRELEILKMDVTQHALEEYREMLEEMGVIHSSELVGLRGKTDVLVAGVRVATQTPPMRSGKRVVFVTLDDGYGCSDATFFDEAQQRCSQILFNNRLLVIAGKTRRTGVKGVSIMAENAWDLRELWQQWKAKKKAG